MSLTTVCVARAQYVEVGHWLGLPPPTYGLALNLDYLWNYNLYEHSRWGLGLRYTYTPSHPKQVYAYTADAFAAYGVGDHRWKWGTRLDLQLRKDTTMHLYADYSHTLLSPGSRRIVQTEALQFLTGNAIMSERKEQVDRLAVGMHYKPHSTTTLGTEVRYSRELPLYDADRLYYLNDGRLPDSIAREQFTEFCLTLHHQQGITVEMTVGAALTAGTPVVRAIAQYDHTWSFRLTELTLHAQGGWSLHTPRCQVPLSRLFDLGGSYGLPLYFPRTFLTVYPSEYFADSYVLSQLRWQMAEPFYYVFDRYVMLGSSPKFFVYGTAATGHLNAHSRYNLDDHTFYLFEGGLGIDGLLLWGLTNWGIAAGCGYVPSRPTFATTTTRDAFRTALLAVVTLQL